MKRLFSLSVLFLLLVGTAFSSPVSQKVAETVATNFLSHHVSLRFADLTIAEVFTVNAQEEAAYYVVNFLPEGWVVVAAEDALTPVLGYNTTGHYSLEGGENHAAWMGHYLDNINYLRENEIAADATIATAWQELENGVVDITTAVVVEPLMPALWNQDSPYNWYAPEATGGPGGRCYAGCVATAMSMVLYYWRWPWSGEGSHSYYSDYGMLSADFGNTEYNYYEMPTSADNKLCESLSLLMYHCAVAVDMNFSPDGSGAFSGDVPAAVKSYFKIDNSANYYEKQTPTSWITQLQAQLDMGYPLYYSGHSNTGGHAFICDGYDDDYNFHFNFGWSGSNNGYYSTNDVGGFASSNAVIRNFIPDQSLYAPECNDMVTINSFNGSVADCSSPVEEYHANSLQSWLISPQTAIDSVKNIKLEWRSFELAAGDEVRLYDGSDNTATLVATYTGETLPDSFTSTSNTLYIEFETDANDEAAGFIVDFYSTLPSYCSGLVTLEGPEGVFEDGSGSFHYASSSNCMWQIEVAPEESVLITFEEFDVLDDGDMLNIYDMGTDELIAELTGDDIPDPIMVEGESVLFIFQSNGADGANGFTISYAIELGVELQNLEDYTNVFPNPATENLQISFMMSEKATVTTSLVDLSGRVVYTNTCMKSQGTQHETIDVSRVQPGVYLLDLKYGNYRSTHQVVVK